MITSRQLAGILIQGAMGLAILAAALVSTPVQAVDWAAGKIFFNDTCLGCHHHNTFANRANGLFPGGASVATIQAQIESSTSDMGSSIPLQKYKLDNCSHSPCPEILNVAAYLAEPDKVRAEPDTLAFGDAFLGDAAVSAQVTLTNGGNLPVAVTQAAVAPDPTGDFKTPLNSCTQLLEDTPCNVTVSFLPKTIHPAGQATLTFSHGTSTTVAVNVGAGLDPLQASPASAAFRSPVGISAAQSLTLHNASAAAFNLTGLTASVASGAAVYAVDSTSECARSASLGAGQSCTLRLTFVPATVGSSTGVASVSHLGSRLDIALSGEGTDATLQFGAVTPPLVTLVGHPSATSTVRVTNVGSTVAVLGVPLVTFGIGFTVLHGPTPPGSPAPECEGFRLPAGGAGACQIRLEYRSNDVTTGDRALVGLPHDGGALAEFVITGAALELATTPFALAVVAPPATVSTGQIVVRNPSGTGTFLGPVDTSGLPAGFSLASNACQATLAPQDTCSLQVRYAPTASAQVSGVLKLQYGPTAATNTAHALFVKVIGSAQPAPFASTSSAVLRFSPTPPGQSGMQSLTLSNLGSAVLNMATTVIDGAGAADFSIGATTCSATLAPGASCDVQVRFKPAAWRSNPARLVIAHDAPGGPSAVVLTGQAWASLAPDRIDFGHVQIGASSGVLHTTLTNSGNLDLKIDAVQVQGDTDAFVDVQSTCVAQMILAPGAACLIARRFAPTTPGIRSAWVTIRHSAFSGQVALALSGQGDLPPTPELQSMQPSVDFTRGRVGFPSQPVAIALRNSGTATVNISGITVAGSQAADFAIGGTCRAGTPLGVGSVCTISTVFTPSLAGSSAAQLVIESDAHRGRIDIALRGDADAAPRGRLGTSAERLDFGTRRIGGPPAQGRIALRNLGDAVVALNGVSIVGEGFAGGANCPGTLAPRSGCEISLRFDPPGDQIDHAGQVAIASDQAGSPTQVALSGRGSVDPPSTLSWLPSNVRDRDFGIQPVGGRSPAWRLQMVNSGQKRVHVQDVVSVGTSAADFSTISTCASGDLFPGMACEVQIVFAPLSAGSKLASLQVLSDGDAPPGPVLTGMTPPSGASGLDVSPRSIDFGNTRRGDTSLVWFTTLRNSGGMDLAVQNLEMNGPFAVSQSSCGPVPFVLHANTQCQLGLIFVPVANDSATGTLVVRNDTVVGGVGVSLRGTGSAPNGVGP